MHIAGGSSSAQGKEMSAGIVKYFEMDGYAD